jgi:hypothetical protein
MSWESTVVGQWPAGKKVSTVAEDIVGIRHQVTTEEDIADWGDLVRDVVNCRVCEFAMAL